MILCKIVIIIFIFINEIRTFEEVKSAGVEVTGVLSIIRNSKLSNVNVALNPSPAVELSEALGSKGKRASFWGTMESGKTEKLNKDFEDNALSLLWT